MALGQRGFAGDGDFYVAGFGAFEIHDEVVDGAAFAVLHVLHFFKKCHLVGTSEVDAVGRNRYFGSGGSHNPCVGIVDRTYFHFR